MRAAAISNIAQRKSFHKYSTSLTQLIIKEPNQVYLTQAFVFWLLSSFRVEESNVEKKKLEHVVKLKDKKIEALESR